MFFHLYISSVWETLVVKCGFPFFFFGGCVARKCADFSVIDGILEGWALGMRRMIGKGRMPMAGSVAYCNIYKKLFVIFLRVFLFGYPLSFYGQEMSELLRMYK